MTIGKIIRNMTSYFDALSDPETGDKIKQQLINSLFDYDKYFGKATFKAQVLSGCEEGHQRQDSTDPNNLFNPSVLRVLDHSDSCIPDPTLPENNAFSDIFKSSHPIAYSDRPFNKKLGFVPRSGQIVDCYYQDPINRRGLTYIYPQEDLMEKEGFCASMNARDAMKNGAQILGDTLIPPWSGTPEGWTHSSGVVIDKNSGAFMNKLAANLKASGFSETIHVTSMRRTPASQARAMVRKMNIGDDLVRLYNDALMNEIFAAVQLKDASISNKKKPIHPVPDNSGPVYEAVKSTLEKQVNRGAYISNHMRPNGKSGIDMRVKNWDNYTDPNNSTMAKVITEIKRLGGTAVFETKPYHLHIGVPDMPQASEGDIIIASEEDPYATSEQ